MILGAYLVLLVALVWLVQQVRDPWLARQSERKQQSARTIVMIPTVLLLVLGVLVTGLQVGPDASPSVLSWLIAALAVTGSVLYGLGVLAWDGRRAFLSRVLGWVLLVAALVIPSTATLALPLVAVLVPTLAVIHGEGPQERRGADVPDAPPG